MFTQQKQKDLKEHFLENLLQINKTETGYGQKGRERAERERGKEREREYEMSETVKGENRQKYGVIQTILTIQL